jgi:hypothetical protein
MGCDGTCKVGPPNEPLTPEKEREQLEARVEELQQELSLALIHLNSGLAKNKFELLAEGTTIEVWTQVRAIDTETGLPVQFELVNPPEEKKEQSPIIYFPQP